MDLNLTLFGEMITFAVLVWVMYKYIWPPLMKIIEERQAKIAEGLEAAEQGRRELELVRKNITKQLREAKDQAVDILNKANEQAGRFVDEAKENAQQEHSKILTQAQADIKHEMTKAKDELQKQTVDLVIAATEKVLQQKLDNKSQDELFDKLISEI